MPFEIVRNDIANMQVDAIVNAASRYPRVNPGVDMAIHKKAGPALLQAREQIGYIEPGSAAITPAFGLDARYVIHAATPTWEGGEKEEERLLKQAYEQCLQLAMQHQCESVAFPLLAAGNHGFPPGKALHIAISAFSDFLMNNEMQIYLVVFSKESVLASEKLVRHIASYIDEHYVEDYKREYSKDVLQASRRRRIVPQAVCKEIAAPMACEFDLGAFLQKKDAGFMETLLEMIAKRGKKNSEVYKKANVSKQNFSKLINNPNATVTKTVAVAFALALELDLAQTKDLIGRAGYTLTNSSVFDLIIQYHIEQKIYNIIAINVVLYEFDQALLGSV